MKGSTMVTLGILIIAAGAILGNIIWHKGTSIEHKQTIQNLEDTLQVKNAELQAKSDEIKDLALQVITLQEKIDCTTASIEEISRDIKQLSNVNHKIASDIKSEQTEKGNFNLHLGTHKAYMFGIGSNAYQVGHDLLLEGYQVTSMLGFPLPLFLRLEDEELKLYSTIVDRLGNIVAELNGNEWAIKRASNFSINYDSTGLEIIDSKGFVCLQVYLRNNMLSINMIHYTQKAAIVVGEAGIVHLPYSDPESLSIFYTKAKTTKRIFKHHGDDYKGKREQN